MEASAKGDITQLLEGAADGDERSRLRLVELVYDELRRQAAALLRHERIEHTLDATALVHEAWLRLFGEAEHDWKNRSYFFATAAELMRRVLVDYARKRRAAKRGAGQSALPISSELPGRDDAVSQTLAVHDALDDLARSDPRKALIVKLRFFGGLSVDEVAAALEVTPRTVKRDWRYARAWLSQRLGPE
jgi:RNA polymerase sigma factor (TIGR02999 family)